MNKDNSCFNYVCTCSGCRWACKRHNIGTQCVTTATNKTAKIITDSNAKENQQKSQKSLRQLVVVPSPADRFPDDLDGYVEPDLYKNHPASFVPSKVLSRRIPPYMNIFIHEHHITPYMQKVNLMSKFNILPDKDLEEIEKYLDISIWSVKSEEKWKMCYMWCVRILSYQEKWASKPILAKTAQWE